MALSRRKSESASEVLTYESRRARNPAIAVAKAISTVAKLNKKKREDSKHDRDHMIYVCFSKSSPGNKKASDSE